MTRLTEDWIDSISQGIKVYENELFDITGFNLTTLAAHAAGINEKTLREAATDLKVAVVPITSGQGIINTFVESVAAVVRAMGFCAYITDRSDVSGILEAHQCGADIILMADDETFVALNSSKAKISDNTPATAKAFVSALIGATGDPAGKKILVIGLGAVGSKALGILREKGAVCSVYDKDPLRTKGFTEQDVYVLSDPSEIKDYDLIFDATSEGDWLSLDMLNPQVFITTPGVPLSVDQDAHSYLLARKKIAHDYLQMGVAVMLAEVL